MFTVLRLVSILLITFTILAATGCGHMPVASMVKLAQVDFQTTDPERLRVAVKLPNALRARVEGTVLRISVRVGRGEEESRDFALREITDRTELQTLAGEADAEARIFAYALAPSDVRELRLFRTALMQQQKGSGGSLTISVRPDTCRTEPLPSGSVVFSSYLKTAETSGYVALARDVDLRRFDPDRDIAAMIPLCH
jgi:hypothetical protein